MSLKTGAHRPVQSQAALKNGPLPGFWWAPAPSVLAGVPSGRRGSSRRPHTMSGEREEKTFRLAAESDEEMAGVQFNAQLPAQATLPTAQ